MLTFFRRRAFYVPAAIVWIASVPVVFSLAGAPATTPRIVEAGALKPPPSLPRVAVRPARASRAARPPLVYVGRDGARITPERLRAYLVRRGSPMAHHASTLIEAGIRYSMDPRSVVALAGAESSFGLVMPCYNAWGWNRGACKWSSWRQAIWSFTRLVSASYPSLRRGDFRTAGLRYNPANWEQWASRCRAYFNAI